MIAFQFTFTCRPLFIVKGKISYFDVREKIKLL